MTEQKRLLGKSIARSMRLDMEIGKLRREASRISDEIQRKQRELKNSCPHPKRKIFSASTRNSYEGLTGVNDVECNLCLTRGEILDRYKSVDINFNDPLGDVREVEWHREHECYINKKHRCHRRQKYLSNSKK